MHDSHFAAIEVLNSPKYKLPEYLYHVSPIPKLVTLKPLSEQHSNDVDGKPLLSLGYPIHGCVQALFLPGWLDGFEFSPLSQMEHLKKSRLNKDEYKLFVYKVSRDILLKKNIVAAPIEKLKNTHVFDAVLTGEVTCSQEVPCESMGSINVRMMTENEYSKSEVGIVVPVTTWCTIPQFTRFQMCIGDFIITPMGDSQLTQEDLIEDRKIFIDQANSFFGQCRQFIKINAAKADKIYSQAIKKTN